MFTFSAPELALLHSGEFNVHYRFLIEDPNGTMREMTALGPGSVDHMLDLTWGERIGDLVASGSASMLKRVGLQSIVPLDQTAALNQNTVPAYEAFIRPGRQCKIYVAVVAKGDAPATWHFAFHGYLDEWQAYLRDELSVAFRDLGSLLADFDIVDSIPYPTASLEGMIQAVLDNSFGAGVVPLYTPVATGVTVLGYTQEPSNMLEALRKLARENEDHDLRYAYDAGTDTFRLTLSKPDLVSMTPAFTMGPSEYVSVNELKENRDEVFNIVRVNWQSGSVQVTDPVSVVEYNPRPIVIEGGETITTATKATDTANTALYDMAQPEADHAIETLAFPPVQIRDVVEWAENLDVYSGSQFWSVTGYEHRFTRSGERRTVITTRSKPMLAGSGSWGSGGSTDGTRIVEQWLTSYSGENIIALMPGYVVGGTKTTPDEWVVPMRNVSRILREGDVISATIGEITPSLNEIWKVNVRFMNAAGGLISEHYAWGVGVYPGAGNIARGAFVKDITVPAGVSEIRIGAKGFQNVAGYPAAAGTALMRLPTLNRGPLAAPYNETSSLKSSELAAVIASAATVEALQMELQSREGQAGSPGGRILTQDQYDATGTQKIIDAALQKVLNATLASTLSVEARAVVLGTLLAHLTNTGSSDLVFRNAIDIAPSTIFVRNENTYADVVGAEQMARDKSLNSQTDGLFRNPGFAEWTGTFPDHVGPAIGVNPTKELSIVGRAKYGMRHNITVANSATYCYTDYATGIVSTFATKPLYMTFEAEMYLVAGGANGLGYILDWVYTDGYRRANIAIASFISSVGRWFRFRYVLKHDDLGEFSGSNLAANFLGFRMYWMPSYFNATQDIKDVIWGRTQLYISTQTEIDAYNAIKTGGAGLKPITWERSGIDEPATNLFKKNSDTMDVVVDGTFYSRVATSDVTGGQVYHLRDTIAANTISVDQIFRKLLPWTSL